MVHHYMEDDCRYVKDYDEQGRRKDDPKTDEHEHPSPSKRARTEEPSSAPKDDDDAGAAVSDRPALPEDAAQPSPALATAQADAVADDEGDDKGDDKGDDDEVDDKADDEGDVIFNFIDRHGISTIPKLVAWPLAECPPFLATAVRAARQQVAAGRVVYLLDLRTNEEALTFISPDNAEEYDKFAMSVHKSRPSSMLSHDGSRMACMITHVR